MGSKDDVADSGIWEHNFRENMVRLRQSAAMTQSDLARYLREEHGLLFHQTTIQRIESGQRPIRLNEAHLIAQALGAGVDEMMADLGSENVMRLYLQTANNALLVRARQISSFIDDQADALHTYRRGIDRMMRNYKTSQKTKGPVDAELIDEADAFNASYDQALKAWEQAAKLGRTL